MRERVRRARETAVAEGRGGARGLGLPLLFALLATVALGATGCASGGPAVGVATVPWSGDVRSASSAVLAAAPDCGLRLLDGREDEASGTATLVLLDEWQSPKPESALVTVRVERAPAGASCRLEAHPLAEYGMRPPDVGAAGGPVACQPCAEARREVPLSQYSRGLALGNAARAVGCLRDALAAAGGG